MILGIGIDSVEVHRFVQWNTYSYKMLSRIFSDAEINYCLEQPNKSAERFAVRFAAREAFFKAFSVAYPDFSVPFLTMCKAITIKKQSQRPYIMVNWNHLMADEHERAKCIVHVSFAHTHATATAFAVIEKR